MTEAILSTVALSVLGFGLRMWFWYASSKAMRGPKRGSRQEHEDYGLSFDERVAKRLSEMGGDNGSGGGAQGFGQRSL